MTTKPPSGLAASGPAEDPESDQITKEHGDDDAEDITVDPSGDVTVEATEDVTIEALAHTPHPSLRPGGGDGTPVPLAGQRAPTLLGVPVHSLPLPGVTASSGSIGGSIGSTEEEDATRSISYDEEITVLAPSAPASDPLAVLDALDRPSITDDDEEETKVEPAEAAMKAAEKMDDVTTALSAQASLEREKALRRSAPPAPSSHGDDLEFADPEAEDEEESLDDELDDDEEVISAGGAIEEEEDDLGQGDDEDDGSGDGVATATFMKPADTTSLSGLLNPRRPPTGGRDGFGSRLPTPYPPPQTVIPAPSTSPFASRLGPAPTGTPYPGRPTGAAMPALQVPPPSGKATTETEPGFLKRQVQMQAWVLIVLVGGALAFGAGAGSAFSGKSTPKGPTVIVAKPTATPAAPPAPVLEPVPSSPTTPTETAAAKPTTPTTPPTEAVPAAKPAAPGPTVTDIPAAPGDNAPEAGLWKPATKKPAAPKVHKVAAADTGEEALLKPKPVVDKAAKPAAPKAAVEKAPKPAAPPAAKPAVVDKAAKPGKKPAKVWVDPFAN